MTVPGEKPPVGAGNPPGSSSPSVIPPAVTSVPNADVFKKTREKFANNPQLANQEDPVAPSTPVQPKAGEGTPPPVSVIPPVTPPSGEEPSTEEFFFDDPSVGKFKTKEEFIAHIKEVKDRADSAETDLSIYKEMLPHLTREPVAPQVPKAPETPAPVEPAKPVGIPMELVAMTDEEIVSMIPLTEEEIEKGVKRDPWHVGLQKYVKRVLDNLDKPLREAINKVAEEKVNTVLGGITQKQQNDQQVVARKTNFFTQEGLAEKYKAFQNDKWWARAMQFANNEYLVKGAPKPMDPVKAQWYLQHPNDWFKFAIDSYIADIQGLGYVAPASPEVPAPGAPNAPATPPAPPTPVQQAGSGSVPRRPSGSKLTPEQESRKKTQEKALAAGYGPWQ